MRNLFGGVLLLLTFGLTIFGQTTKNDLEQIRKQAGLPDSTVVGRDNSIFPAAKPIKIFLAIKHSRQAAKSFIDWAERWNKTDAARFGQIQIVDKIEDADIAAVQYQYGVGRVVREDSARLKIGKVPAGNPSDASNRSDRTVLGGVGNGTVRAETAVRNLTIPLYTYLIARSSNAAWSVDYARVDDRVADQNFPEQLLQSTIESRLKSR